MLTLHGKDVITSKMMRRICVFALGVMLATALWAQSDTSSQDVGEEIQVEGTEHARLPYVLDVLKRVPTLNVTDEDVIVIGRGWPIIYIEQRKVTEFSELSHLAASRVRSIEVLTNPGAEYDKDAQAVIVIHLIPDAPDGLNVDETMHLDLTNKLSVNNELGVTWKKNGLTIDAFLAYNEEHKNFYKEEFKYHYKNQELIQQDTAVQNPLTYKQRITARLNADYDFNKNHHLGINYALMFLRQNRTITPETANIGRAPETRYDVGAEYTGNIGQWKLTVGNNTYFYNINDRTNKPVEISYYPRDEVDIRTYAMAKTPLWKGNVQMGAEYEFDHMEVSKYNVSTIPSPIQSNDYHNIHALHPEHTFAAFASIDQMLGRWDVEAGLRYEHRYMVYRPCSDDGLMRALIDLRDAGWIHPDHLGDLYIARMLLVDGQASMKTDFFYPTLRISTQVGKSHFSLIHSQSGVRPNLALTRLSLSDVAHIEDQIVVTERVLTTSLNWRYAWANISATYNHYIDPICGTFDGSIMYNAPNYNAIDLKATLSPRIGWWSPVLGVNMHKQWFGMELANGKDRLQKVLVNINFNNTLTLPYQWMIIVDANWHSKGAERNWYYYSSDLQLTASVQKTFSRPRLTFTLRGSNLIGNSFLDTTRYTQAYKNISEGTREENIRCLTFMVNWKF